jgi:hypothetical protein
MPTQIRNDDASQGSTEYEFEYQHCLCVALEHHDSNWLIDDLPDDRLSIIPVCWGLWV